MGESESKAILGGGCSKECLVSGYAVEMARPKWATGISKMQRACMREGESEI